MRVPPRLGRSLERTVLLPVLGFSTMALGFAAGASQGVLAGNTTDPSDLLLEILLRSPTPSPARPAVPAQPLADPQRFLVEPSQVPARGPLDPKLPGRLGFIWPARGVLSSGYGWRWGRQHRGIDIANDVGTPIVAAADGRIIFAGWSEGGYGFLVEIQHPDGTLTRYGHNSKIMVKRGQSVGQGDVIALMGNTGRSTGPHLHFEILPLGRQAVNPLPLLPGAS